MCGAYRAHSVRLRPVPTRLHTWFLSSVKLPHRKPDHSRTVSLVEASMVPSELNATLVTGPALPVSGKPSCVWVATSHSLARPSCLAGASVLPSALYSTLV